MPISRKFILVEVRTPAANKFLAARARLALERYRISEHDTVPIEVLQVHVNTAKKEKKVKE